MLSAARPRRWLPPPDGWPRETRDTLFLLALVGWIVLPQAPYLPGWCLAGVAAVLLWRGVLALRARPLPRRLWLIALLAGATAATRLTHGTLVGQDAGVTLVVSLLALKTLELRARRDALVIFFLGFFTMLTGFFHSQSLASAAVMLVGVWGLLTALINAHRPVGQPSLRESAALALRMALLGAPIMLALFVFFPRLAPLWGMPSDELRGRTGLSSTMSVGKVAELALDDGIALRLRFDGAPPPPGALYFRGPVLSHFDGRDWTARGGEGFEAAFSPPPADLQVRGAPMRYEATLEPSARPWLLLLDAAPQPPELPSGWHAQQTASLQWLARRPVTERLRYQAQSWADFSYGLQGDDRSANLQLPPGYNPRTLALASHLQAAHGAPQAIVQAALQRLRTGGYRYTLEPGLPGRDSADTFWFDSRAGFCEHIASAVVVRLRAAGVPARIVTGCQGGELNGVDGWWTVRNADAHAWAEVWLAGRGWMRVDPTGAVTPSRIGQELRLRAPPGLVAGAIGSFSPNLLRQLRATWEAVNNRWNQWVLNYSQGRQMDLLRGLGFAQPSWEDLGKVLAGLLTLAALAGAAWARWERAQHDPWLRLLQAARQRLRQAGIRAPVQAAPRELARLVDASALPAPVRAALCAWLLTLERQRYGAGAAPSVATLQREFRRLPWPRPH